MSDQHKIGSELHRKLILFSTLKDTEGPQWNDLNIFSFMLLYLKGRQSQKWSEETKKLLRPAFQSILNYLLERLQNIFIKHIMMLKSMLVFMSTDFPELAESIMYSPLMEQLDEAFDMFINVPTFKNLCTLLGWQMFSTSSGVTPSTHSWWNLPYEIERKLEIPPPELIELYAGINQRKTEEIEAMNAANSLKSSELKKRHEINEKARWNHKSWALISLEYEQNIANMNVDTRKFYADGLEGSRLARAKSMTDLLDAVNEIYNNLLEMSFTKDVRGSNANVVLYVYWIMTQYFKCRRNQEWKKDAKKLLHSAFLPSLNYLLRGLDHMSLSLENALTFKSALTYMSVDFPEFAESLMYSPLMCRIDDMIESWKIKVPHLNDMFCVWTAKETVKRSMPSPKDIWWNIVDDIESRIDIPQELTDLMQELNSHRDLEIASMNSKTVDPTKLDAIRDQHEKTEKHRFNMRAHKLCHLVAVERLSKTDKQLEIKMEQQNNHREHMKRVALERAKEEDKFDQMVEDSRIFE